MDMTLSRVERGRKGERRTATNQEGQLGQETIQEGSRKDQVIQMAELNREGQPSPWVGVSSRGWDKRARRAL